jgi:hypothetical protein
MVSHLIAPVLSPKTYPLAVGCIYIDVRARQLLKVLVQRGEGDDENYFTVHGLGG